MAFSHSKSGWVESRKSLDENVDSPPFAILGKSSSVQECGPASAMREPGTVAGISLRAASQLASDRDFSVDAVLVLSPFVIQGDRDRSGGTTVGREDGLENRCAGRVSASSLFERDPGGELGDHVSAAPCYCGHNSRRVLSS